MNDWTVNLSGWKLAYLLPAFLVLAASLLPSAQAAVAAPAIIQHKSVDAGSVASASVAFGSSNTAHNFIAVVIRIGGGTIPAITVTDTNKNTYQQAFQFDGTLGGRFIEALYYAENIAFGANTVTVSYNTVAVPLRIAVAEYAGIATSASLDKVATAQGTSAYPDSGSITPSQNEELLIGDIVNELGETWTAGAGWTSEETVPTGSGSKLLFEDSVQTTAAPVDATAAMSASGNWIAGIASFKGASSGSPDTTPPSVPTGLTATAVSSSQVNLSWTASTDPDNTASQISYKVFRNGVQVATTATGATTYSDIGLAPSTTYSYTIAAADPAGNASAQSAAVSATTSAGSPPPTAIRIGAGATTSYTDSAGNTWTADQFFSGGTVYKTGNSITGTQAPKVYQSERYGGASSFQYNIPVANGAYSVNLDFAETYVTGPGQRLFGASINGTQVLSNFDIYATAGGMNRAVVKTFTASVTNGTLNITFIPGSIQNPKVDGIEVLQGSGGPPPDTTPPSVPTGLTATAVSTSQVNLSWTASTDPDNTGSQISYKVYRNGSQVGGTSAGITSYSDSNLSPSTTYSYTVSAYDPAGNSSAQSVSASATTSGAPPPDTTPPSVPTGLTATAASSSQVNLSWTASTDPDNTSSQISYKVYRNGSQVGGTSAGITSYSDSNLSPSTTYSYTISAYDPAGNSSAQSVSASATTQAASTVTWPIKMSSNHRYLTDQNGVPWLMVADSAHHIVSDIPTSSYSTYLSNRKAKSFNAINIFAVCAHGNCPSDGSAQDGARPFTTGTGPSSYDLSTPNNAYWSEIDNLVSMAASNGLVVIITELDMADFLTTYQNNGPTKVYNFGAYLGNRYKIFDNIIWVAGNDFQTWRTSSDNYLAAQLMAGIASADTRHLQTIQLDYFRSYSNQDSGTMGPYLGADFVYSYYETYDYVLAAYNSASTLPAFLGEANYEGGNNTGALSSLANALITRRQMYWTMTSGASGHLWGNESVDHFDAYWQNNLNTPATAQVALLTDLFASYQWWNLAPDQTHQVVTAGYGTYNGGNENLYTATYATTAWIPDGSLSLTYAPVSTTLTVNLSKFVRPVVARWYDPTNGTFSPIGGSPFPNAGSYSFMTPVNNYGGDSDWVLVLEAP